MAEFIGDEGFLETIVDDTRRPANHKAQWTEAALRELEMLVMRKESFWGDWDKIIELLEVEPRESAPSARFARAACTSRPTGSCSRSSPTSAGRRRRRRT